MPTRKITGPKLIALSNAFLASIESENPPQASTDSHRWGRWLENACIARAVNAGYQVSYWREESREVDMIINGEEGKWAIEVKSSAFTYYDLVGLMEFYTRHHDYRPLVIGEEAYRDAAVRCGIEFLDWRKYLLDGLPG